MKTLFGLPEKVLFCKKSLISNQRPSSAVEFKHTLNQKKTLNIDRNGLSDSWKYSRQKLKINFNLREKELLRLLENIESMESLTALFLVVEARTVVMHLTYLNLNMV